MDTERITLLRKEVKKLRRQQDNAFRNYQDTGYRKYDTAAYRCEVIADALDDYLRMAEEIACGRSAIGKIRVWAGMLRDFNFRPQDEQTRITKDILAEIRISSESL